MWGRFLNADAFATTGQGLLGSNMFAYCLNNPIRYVDCSGLYTVDFETTINGVTATIEASKTTSYGTLTLTIVIDVTLLDEYTAYFKDLAIDIGANSIEIRTPGGQAFSFNYDINGVEADTHNISLIRVGKSSVGMAVSKNGWGVNYNAQADGLEYDVTLSYKPSWLGVIIYKIGKAVDKAVSAYSPAPVSIGGGWKATSRYTNLAFAARYGTDLFDPVTCFICR